jgi:Tol biopolymer transport system component
MIGVDGKNERRLTRSSLWEEQPRFSRDGKRILFVADGRVFVMNADRGNPRELGAGSSADWR